MSKYELVNKVLSNENGTSYYIYTYQIRKEDGTMKTKTIKRKYTPKKQKKEVGNAGLQQVA